MSNPETVATRSLPHLDVPDSLRESYVQEVDELAERIRSGEFSDWGKFSGDCEFCDGRADWWDDSSSCCKYFLRCAVGPVVHDLVGRFFYALASRGLLGRPYGVYAAVAYVNAELLIPLVPAGFYVACVFDWMHRDGTYSYRLFIDVLDEDGYPRMTEEE